MKKLFILLLFFGAYNLWGHFGDGAPEQQLAHSHDEVIMYSLTTCGYCKLKASELDEAGIFYKEYFIDKNVKRRDELTTKLKQAGFAPKSWGTPILDVKGMMMPNNPSLKKIREYL
jgi:glutaredoxin